MSWNTSVNFQTVKDINWDSEKFKIVVEDFKDSLFTLSDPMTIVLIVFYVPIFITSLTGNILVLLVILPNQRMWSVTNNFLVNLSVADLLVTILCMPMTVAAKVYQMWVYGDILCKMSPYLQGVSVTSSTFTITAMSLDRCLAILHPMKFRNLRTKRNVRILIAAIWITSGMLMTPLLVVYQTRSQEVFPGVLFTKCAEDWSSVVQRRAYDICLLFIVCLIPAQIVLVSYVLMGKRLWVTDAQLKAPGESKSVFRGSGSEKNSMDSIRANRRRLAKMCIVVSIVFVVCWLPYYTVNIYLDFATDPDALNIVYWGLLIGHLHCITNPILYCFLHKTFRYCVKRLLPCWTSQALRSPSAYGTNAYAKYRMTSVMVSTRSRTRSQRSSNQSNPTPPVPPPAGRGSKKSQLENNHQTKTDTTANSIIDSSNFCDNMDTNAHIKSASNAAPVSNDNNITMVLGDTNKGRTINKDTVNVTFATEEGPFSKLTNSKEVD